MCRDCQQNMLGPACAGLALACSLLDHGDWSFSAYCLAPLPDVVFCILGS